MSWLSDLFSDGSKDQYNAAKRSEAEKQRLIDEGLARINAIFEGGSAPIYTKATVYDPTKQYYMLKNNKYVPYVDKGKGKNKGTFSGTVGKLGQKSVVSLLDAPTGMPLSEMGGMASKDIGDAVDSIFGNKKKKYVPPERFIEKGELYTMDSPTYEGFGEDFYNKRAQTYVDYALPQLKAQFMKAYNDANFSLADRGLLHSSVAEQTQTGMRRQLGQEEQNVWDTGQSQAQQLKKDIETAKQNAIALLYTTSDPAGASAAALSSANSANWPNIMSPLVSSFFPGGNSGGSSSSTGSFGNNIDWNQLSSMFSNNSALPAK